MRGYQFHILIMPTGSSAQKIGYPLLSYARERGKGREVEKGGISYKSKTDKRKPHSGIIKTLLEEVARLLSEHSLWQQKKSLRTVQVFHMAVFP